MSTKTRLATLLLIFWFVFPISLMVLEYSNVKGLFVSDLFIDTSEIENFQIEISGLDVIETLMNGIVMIAKTIILVVLAIANVIIFIVHFLFIFVKTLTLTYKDINYFLARFINVIQILSMIFIGLFVRGGGS